MRIFATFGVIPLVESKITKLAQLDELQAYFALESDASSGDEAEAEIVALEVKSDRGRTPNLKTRLFSSHT